MWGSPNSVPTENANVALLATSEKLDKLLDILSGKFWRNIVESHYPGDFSYKRHFSVSFFYNKKGPTVFIKARREIQARRPAEPTRS